MVYTVSYLYEVGRLELPNTDPVGVVSQPIDYKGAV
jgi:hypothetical protein